MTEGKSPVVYEPSTDTMAIEIRPWPGGEGEAYGGEDAGPDLVIHYAPDGTPWLWEIEHASQHPEHIIAALTALRSAGGAAADRRVQRRRIHRRPLPKAAGC
jgi:hypothetical protein